MISKMKLVYASLFLLLFLDCLGQKNKFKSKVDNVVNVERMPYFPRLSGDSLFWELTVDRKILPYLIERLTDTTRTKAPVMYFGNDYVIGDVCLRAIEELIPDFHTVDLIEQSKDVIEEKGYGVYWEYVRASFENRKEFQKKLKHWYQQNKTNLVWVKDENLYPVTENENPVRKKIPAGGFYELKSKR